MNGDRCDAETCATVNGSSVLLGETRCTAVDACFNTYTGGPINPGIALARELTEQRMRGTFADYDAIFAERRALQCSAEDARRMT